LEHSANLVRALRWFQWAIEQDVAVVADWILYCHVWNDFIPEHREKGLRHDDAMILKCDEFWMVGGEITGGMARGRETAKGGGVKDRDFTHLGPEPPKGEET